MKSVTRRLIVEHSIWADCSPLEEEEFMHGCIPIGRLESWSLFVRRARENPLVADFFPWIGKTLPLASLVDLPHRPVSNQMVGDLLGWSAQLVYSRVLSKARPARWLSDRGDMLLTVHDGRWHVARGMVSEQTSMLGQLRQQRSAGLVDLLGRLDEIQDVNLLLKAVREVTAGRLEIPAGILPDYPAIELLKRLVRVDEETGFEAIRELFRRNADLPFRDGYFQLSLTGIVLAMLSRGFSLENYRTWIWNEIRYLRKCGIPEFQDFPLGRALLAALIAIALIGEDATSESIDVIDREIDESLKLSTQPKHRAAFLRFLGDSLSQGITYDNLHKHLLKLMIFFKHGKHEPSLVRQNNRLLSLLRETFEPAKELFLQ